MNVIIKSKLISEIKKSIADHENCYDLASFGEAQGLTRRIEAFNEVLFIIEQLSLSRDELLELEKELNKTLHTCSGCDRVITGPHACPGKSIKKTKCPV